MQASRVLPRMPNADRFSTETPSTTAPSHRVSLTGGRTARRLALGGLFWLAIFAMAFPALATGGLPASALGMVTPTSHISQVATPAALSSAPAPAKASPTVATSSALAGASPKTDTPLDAADAAALAVGQTKFAALDARAAAPGSPLLNVVTSGVPTTTPAAAAPLVPHTGFYLPTGTFYGYLYDAETGKAVAGATVQAYSVSGANCPATAPYCAPAATTANGSFSVVGPVGFDYISYSAPWYIGNISYATASNGTRVNVGTIYIVESAIIKGIVRGDTPPSDPALAGIAVSDAPTDLSYLLNPGGATLNNGSFEVAGADAPSIVTFTPPAGLWLSNFTWTNATPGEVVNIGTVYLERLTEVKMNVTDAVTGGALSIEGTHDASLQVCSLADGCGATEQGMNEFTAAHGPTVLTAFAQPGANYAVIEVVGYVYAQVTLPHVPKLAPGHVYWAPPQNITPVGFVNVSVGLAGNDLQSGTGAKLEAEHTGWWTATVCTMNSLDVIAATYNQRTGEYNTSKTNCASNGCLPPGDNVSIEAAPLRDYITVQPDVTGACNNGIPTWSIPGGNGAPPAQLPVWPNETWMNVTPRMTTNIGWVNLTAGTYLNGNVTVAGTSIAPANYSVTVSSLNYPTLGTYAYGAGVSNWATWACGPASASKGPNFCAPAPPGPDLVTVQAPGYPNNITWISTPENYVNLPNQTHLAQATNEWDTSVNLTAGGFITANVTQNTTNFGIPLAGIEACSILPSDPVGCTTGSTNLQGKFNFSAPLGWDYVKVAAAGYAPDFVWAYVNASFETVHLGNIGLQPLARIEGLVVDPNGNPVLGATASICSLTTPIGAPCTALGAGRVSSSGLYLGTVEGGWLPEATYRVQVTAAGYTENWAWVNATAGALTNVSTLTLYPSGSNGTTGSIQVNTWLVGELVDNVSGWGVTTGNVQVCPLGGGPCYGVGVTGSNTGGFFNITIPAGLYYVNVTANGYEPSTTFVNTSGASYYNLGTIYLEPLPWVSGMTQINPWATLYSNIGTTKVPNWVSFKMGPYASIEVCTSALVCATTSNGFTTQNGSFDVWGEYGRADTVKINPAATATSTSASGGYIANNTTVTIPNYVSNVTVPGGPFDLAIFASVTFGVMDNVSWMKNSFGITPVAIRYSGTAISTIGPNTAFVGQPAGGGGNITYFIPPLNGLGKTSYSASVAGAWESGTATLITNPEPGMSYYASNLTLTHFGWEVGQAVTGSTGQPAAYLPVIASATPAHSPVIYTSDTQTNGAGFFNVSVAPAFSAKFTVGPGNDFDTAVFYAESNYSNTSAYRSLTLTPKNISVNHWGLLASSQVNYSAFPVISTVMDLVKGLPLPLTNLVVSTVGGNETSSATLSLSNDGGQFLVDAPDGQDWANFSRSVYESNDSRINVAPSEHAVDREINLTGDGVVAARVVSEPGNIPVSAANITDCLGGQVVCGSSETNGSGIFWVNATPGTNWINVSANGFIPAGPTLAQVCSDCFVSLPEIPVYQPAYISGIVRGLPTGLPISNANVSACSPDGTPTGPCQPPVQSHTTGSFLLVVPAGSYELAVQDPDYNATYLSINVHAGEHVDVGTVFLEAFGAIAGSVFSNTTIGPLADASVLGCPVWAGASCVGATTGPTGRYLLQGPPGPYVITIAANGFEDSLIDATLVGGKTTVAPTAFLVPLGTGGTYPVSGVVYADGVGLANAVVAATTGGVVAASTSTGANGAFTMGVQYGTYTLVVTAAGEATTEVPLVVHGEVSGVTVTLSPQTYPVSGLVTDGLTGLPLGGVQILVGTTIMATTNATGRYTVDLGNGEWVITAEYAGSSDVNYGSEQVAITVSDTNVVRNVQLFPIETVVFGLVVDSASGASLPGAAVTIVGFATDGKKIDTSLTTSPSGAFQLSLPQGSYTVTGTYGGYANQSVAFKPNGASNQLTVSLASTETPSVVSTPASTAWTGVALAVGAVAVAAVAMVALGLRSARRRKGGPSGGTP
jgi:Carboxypeptidase regulatory-like domain